VSETITIKRNIYDAAVDVTVYEAKCADCDGILAFSVIADRDNDLTIEAEPCPRCIKAAVDAAKAEAAKERSETIEGAS